MSNDTMRADMDALIKDSINKDGKLNFNTLRAKTQELANTIVYGDKNIADIIEDKALAEQKTKIFNDLTRATREALKIIDPKDWEHKGGGAIVEGIASIYYGIADEAEPTHGLVCTGIPKTVDPNKGLAAQGVECHIPKSGKSR